MSILFKTNVLQRAKFAHRETMEILSGVMSIFNNILLGHYNHVSLVLDSRELIVLNCNDKGGVNRLLHIELDQRTRQAISLGIQVPFHLDEPVLVFVSFDNQCFHGSYYWIEGTQKHHLYTFTNTLHSQFFTAARECGLLN